MENSNKFINIYNALDQYMRDELNEDSRTSHIQLIEKISRKSNLFRHYRNDLKEFAELRNAIIHNTHFSGNRYGEVIAEPHDVVVEMYEELYLKITKPKTAKDLYRKITLDVFTAKKETVILDLIKAMYNKDFTCVPIIENNKLIGVFSENVLLSLIAKTPQWDYQKLTIEDILEDIHIHNHHGEYFEFCKVNDTLFDIKDLFQKQNEYKKRLEMIFVTGNGYQNEDILGVITAWDLV